MGATFFRGSVVWVLALGVFLFFQGAYAVRLKGINLQTQKNKVGLRLEMDDEFGQYDTKTRMENNIVMASFIFPGVTASKDYKLDLVRPMHFVEVLPSDEGGFEVILYLEKGVAVNHQRQGKNVVVEFDWDPAADMTSASVIESLEISQPEDKFASLKFEFDQMPKQKSIFLSKGKKKVIASFPQSVLNEQGDLTTIDLLSKVDVLTYRSDRGVPSVKIIGTSNEELTLEVSKEDNRLFIHLNTMVAEDPMPTPVVVTEEEEEDDTYTLSDANQEHETGKSRASELLDLQVKDDEGSGAWVYWTLGAGLLGGGAVAAYYLLPEDDKNPPVAGAIPDPNISFPCGGSPPPCK